MNMTTKLKIDTKQASELMAEGYEVECYLVLPPAEVRTRKKILNKAPYVPVSAKLSLAVKPKSVPQLGHIAEIWPLVCKRFFKSDPTNQVKRSDLEAWVVENGGKKNMVSQYIHAYGCLRVVP